MGISSGFPPAGLAVLSTDKTMGPHWMGGADAVLRFFVDR
jgi:hypothetical protein